MKFMYQSILIGVFLVIMAPMCGFKYAFHNKTDVNLYVTYFYKIEKNLVAKANYITLSPGEAKAVDTGNWCMGEKIIVQDLFNEKYKQLQDFAPVPRCRNREWDIVVKKGKTQVYLDLVDHSDKNKNLLEDIGKPSRSISVGQ